MQLQFSKKTLPYLRRAVWEVKNEEYTQEVKLAESLPDIGKILGAWGQPMIRSKEWRGSSMSVSGGIMAWILYAQEEGQHQCVETWIPFQTQWEFAQTQHDAAMRVACNLKGIDARSVSARKMMVRAVLSIAGEALEPTQADWYQCEENPEDIQLLRSSYPVRLPAEAGEKIITLDEELTPDSHLGQITKILRCTLQPEMVDQKIMADKVVYRGIVRAEFLCCCGEEKMEHCEYEIPFSQYSELEREYDSSAISDVIPTITNLEIDVQENGTLRLKAGLVGQYVIYDTNVLELVTDAYSNQRTVELQRQELALPAVLDIAREVIPIDLAADNMLPDTVDLKLMLQYPTLLKNGDTRDLELIGGFQLLGRDEKGELAGIYLKWENSRSVLADGKTTLLARCSPKGKTEKSANSIRADVMLEMLTTAQTEIPMVSGLELGELQSPSEDRPSLILRRVGNESLWEIAKSCASTVEAIRVCNGLTGEPQEESVLLIPVS